MTVLLICLQMLPGASAGGKTAAERGCEALMSADPGEVIVLPREESYLEEWKTRYARKAWYAPSLFVERMSQVNSGLPYLPFLFEGTEATVVAEENDMSCILYGGEDNRTYAGWIQSIRLLEDFPGETYSIGVKPEGEPRQLTKIGVHWSREYFPGSEQFYTVLDEKASGAVGFTLEYQLIAENTSLKEIVMGPRILYIHNGEEWVEIGRFPYPENGTVRVQAGFEEPTDITAVATIAECHAPNMFDFRQTIKDIWVGQDQAAETE